MESFIAAHLGEREVEEMRGGGEVQRQQIHSSILASTPPQHTQTQ